MITWVGGFVALFKFLCVVPFVGPRGVEGNATAPRDGGGCLGPASWRCKWANRVVAGCHGAASAAWALWGLSVLYAEQRDAAAGSNLFLPIAYDTPRDGEAAVATAAAATAATVELALEWRGGG